MGLLTVHEVAELLRVTPARAYAMAREGIFPLGVVVRLGRQVRFNEAALREWVAAGGQALPGGWRRDRAGAA